MVQPAATTPRFGPTWYRLGPMRFGPFEILRPLGRGGMAETFLAVRSGGDGYARPVCLKRVLAERAAEPDFVRGFQREARLAARLVHPHIAQVYEFGAEGETWWMALEHVPGGDLRALLRALGQPMPLDLGLVLAVDMLEALGYAHEIGIVHRDVSPSNILLDLQGNFKLVDFGIAKSRHVDRAGETAYSTTTGTIKGKAAYMAPEQALGQEVDGRADLWSFGVVLYEAFASAKPFEGTTDLAIMMAASQGRRRALADVAPHVPSDVCAVVERLLSPSAAERFQTAGEVLDALAHRPAPVQGRRRLAEMLKAVGAGSAVDQDIAAPTVISGAPDATEVARAALEDRIADSERVDAATPAHVAHVAPAAIAAVPRSPAHVLGPRTAWLLLGALVAGAATAGLLVLLRSPSARVEPVAPSPPASSTAAGGQPVPAMVVEPVGNDPPMARGVSVPDLLPGGDGAAGRSPAAPERERQTGSGRRTTPPSPRAEPPAADGTVHVTVIPWGDVSIDGRPLGRSPVTATLPPGSHRVEVRSESGTELRHVRVAAGSREEVEIDLTD